MSSSHGLRYCLVPMDFQEFRAIFQGPSFWTEAAALALSRYASQGFNSISKVPKTVLDTGTSTWKMFPSYIAGRLAEARDPKILKCKSIDEVHECHREPGIISGYRCEDCSVTQAVYSLFRATNETMNFWTHFLPTIYFFWIFFSLSSTLSLFSDPYLLPFVCYMITSCAYPLVSCMAHAFSCLSLTALHVCFFMDYATLSLYSWGAAILYYNYGLPPQMIGSFYAQIYIPVASVNAVLSIVMACSSRFVKSLLLQKILRLGAFVIPYIWDSIPLIYRLIYCDEALDTCALSGTHHVRQFLLVSLAAFFYGSHIPERLAPGRFDFVGHSHNLLHLFGISATYEQLKGALVDLQGRRSQMEATGWTSAPEWVTVVTPAIVVANMIIIALYTRKLTNSGVFKTQKSKVN